MNKHSKILAETALWIGVGQMVMDAFKKPHELSMGEVVHSSHWMTQPGRRGSSNCVHCGGTWDGVSKTYSTKLETYCHARDLPPRKVCITLSPEETVYFADVQKYGCQKAGQLQRAREKVAKAEAKTKAKTKKHEPDRPRQAQPPQPVHIRREAVARVEDVAAINALKPLAHTDLMDLLVRLRDWLAYWEVKDVDVTVEEASIVCRVRSQENWNRITAMWAKDIAVVRI